MRNSSSQMIGGGSNHAAGMVGTSSTNKDHHHFTSSNQHILHQQQQYSSNNNGNNNGNGNIHHRSHHHHQNNNMLSSPHNISTHHISQQQPLQQQHPQYIRQSRHLPEPIYSYQQRQSSSIIPNLNSSNPGGPQLRMILDDPSFTTISPSISQSQSLSNTPGPSPDLPQKHGNLTHPHHSIHHRQSPRPLRSSVPEETAMNNNVGLNSHQPPPTSNRTSSSEHSNPAPRLASFQTPNPVYHGFQGRSPQPPSLSLNHHSVPSSIRNADGPFSDNLDSRRRGSDNWYVVQNQAPHSSLITPNNTTGIQTSGLHHDIIREISSPPPPPSQATMEDGLWKDKYINSLEKIVRLNEQISKRDVIIQDQQLQIDKLTSQLNESRQSTFAFRKSLWDLMNPPTISTLIAPEKFKKLDDKNISVLEQKIKLYLVDPPPNLDELKAFLESTVDTLIPVCPEMSSLQTTLSARTVGGTENSVISTDNVSTPNQVESVAVAQVSASTDTDCDQVSTQTASRENTSQNSPTIIHNTKSVGNTKSNLNSSKVPGMEISSSKSKKRKSSEDEKGEKKNTPANISNTPAKTTPAPEVHNAQNSNLMTTDSPLTSSIFKMNNVSKPVTIPDQSEPFEAWTDIVYRNIPNVGKFTSDMSGFVKSFLLKHNIEDFRLQSRVPNAARFPHAIPLSYQQNFLETFAQAFGFPLNAPAEDVNSQTSNQQTNSQLSTSNSQTSSSNNGRRGNKSVHDRRKDLSNSTALHKVNRNSTSKSTSVQYSENQLILWTEILKERYGPMIDLIDRDSRELSPLRSFVKQFLTNNAKDFGFTLRRCQLTSSDSRRPTWGIPSELRDQFEEAVHQNFGDFLNNLIAPLMGDGPAPPNQQTLEDTNPSKDKDALTTIENPSGDQSGMNMPTPSKNTAQAQNNDSVLIQKSSFSDCSATEPVTTNIEQDGLNSQSKNASNSIQAGMIAAEISSDNHSVVGGDNSNVYMPSDGKSVELLAPSGFAESLRLTTQFKAQASFQEQDSPSNIALPPIPLDPSADMLIRYDQILKSNYPNYSSFSKDMRNKLKQFTIQFLNQQLTQEEQQLPFRDRIQRFKIYADDGSIFTYGIPSHLTHIYTNNIKEFLGHHGIF